jgi:hypothetical protein
MNLPGYASADYGRRRARAGVIFEFHANKCYKMSRDTFQKALARVEVNPGFPGDLKPYMQEQAEILLKARIISAIPDWSKALRPDFMERARAGTLRDNCRNSPGEWDAGWSVEQEYV